MNTGEHETIPTYESTIYVSVDRPPKLALYLSCHRRWVPSSRDRRAIRRHARRQRIIDTWQPRGAPAVQLSN